ncbi:MAG TPA: glycine cleavage system protein GcvH [Clostridiaceae bacterium]|nr:glycine cleavage system protein GcvH [Clostridiaceae bacterium]
MSIVLEGLYYSKDHEWVRMEGEKAFIGITDFAQHALGSIVYVELPEVGDEIVAEDNLGVVESVKAASDIIMPVSGEILEVNEETVDNPESINSAPYDNYLVVVALKDPEELNDLMNKEAYEEFISKEE